MSEPCRHERGLTDVLAQMPGTQLVIEAQCRALIAENTTLTAEVAELKADHSATFREGMLGIREGTKALLSVGAERDEARAEVERLKVELADCKTLASAVIEQLTTERDEMLAAVQRIRAIVDDPNAALVASLVRAALETTL